MANETAEFQVLESNRQFTTNFYNLLAERPGNVFFSPISVHAVLSMSYQGAKGTTAEKFASTLKVPAAADVADGYRVVMNRLRSIPNVTLLMANSVYLMENYQLLPEFNKVIIKDFLSDVQVLNFAENEAAAARINAWVEENTKEKIKNLINKNDLSASTRLVLVNAIYFKGSWMHKFNKELTRTGAFYINDIDSVGVQMMHTKRRFYYTIDETLGAQILALPYSNEDLSMLIILPYEKNGIAELEKKLTSANLTEITQRMKHIEVNVTLPKFKIEQTIDLKHSLTQFGLGEIFSPAANFSGMITANEELYVGKAIHKAFIEVNEEGAEAAAATAKMIVKRCGKPPPRHFQADHPFLYFLSEKRENHLFVGRLLNPASE
ncbi:hypothetical protein Zmor_014017 [Zophobas morio]|uniref:Serpin domain-containing protein n=1 Tax=Zophobas morio TaxID=2755281 RepID=A0AA38IGY4_9CUCU|nr:hypothetical protein Zmor_014017 [Zophobas morio]